MKVPLPGSIKGLVTLIVTLALLPALGLILYSGYVNTRSNAESLNLSALNSAQNIARHYKLIVESTRSLLLTLSHLEEVRTKDTRACSVIFQYLMLHSAVYGNLRLCDADGRVIASAASAPEPLSAPEREMFKLASFEKNFLVQELPRGPDRLSPMLNCLFPLRTGGQVTAVLMASIIIAVPKPDLEGIVAGQLEYLHILDGQGRTILAFPSGNEANSAAAPKECRNWPAIKAHQEPHGIITGQAHGISAFQKLTLTSEEVPYLTAVLGISTAAMHARIQEQMIRNLLLLFGATGLGILINWKLCTLTLINPVRKLLTVANRLKKGDLNVRVSMPRMARELAILSDAFNSMSVALEIQDNALISARDVANAASRAKSDFLANMSHEIRTPMNAILGMTYLALRSSLTDQQRGYLEKIHAEAASLLVVINDILDFSKIEAGKVLIESTAFEFIPAVQSVINAADSAAREKGLALTVRLSPDLPGRILGDPLHLSQVLSNILGNAVQYTTKGRVHFACAVHSEEAETALRFTIIDTGVGMNKDRLARFYPAEENLGDGRSFEGGSGLNLFITRRLVNLMRGRLTATSNPGRGTAVTIDIPFTTPDDASGGQDAPTAEETEAAAQRVLPPHENERTPEPQKPDAQADPPPLVDLTGVKLLLVEDNIINQQIAEEILSSAGATVHIASNGIKALEMLEEMPKSAPYRVILMDLQMPELDGLATTRRIRLDARAHVKHLPVIAMTAHAMSEEWGECLSAGMDDYISKPIDIPALFATLKKWLARKVSSF